jgi:hypothetical protein
MWVKGATAPVVILVVVSECAMAIGPTPLGRRRRTVPFAA